LLLKEKISNLISKIVEEIFNIKVDVIVENSKISKLGDISSNIAMVLAGKLKQNPFSISEKIKQNLEKNNLFESVNVSKPGFINIKLKKFFLRDNVLEILNNFQEFNKIEYGKNKKYNIEFVSANPTGPLNIVSARAASTGAALANLLKKIGFEVEKEFYVNDAGNQIEIFGSSVKLRYFELFGKKIVFPDNYYQGEYVIKIAQYIKDKYNDELLSLSENDQQTKFKELSKEIVLEWQKKDLENYGIIFDNWYSEFENLHKTNKVSDMLDSIKSKDLTYEKDGAFWFKTTNFGDDKDRILVRSNGTPTYFLADIAYHKDKFDRGFTDLLDLWGPDHHGHIKRTKLALKGMGLNNEKFNVMIIQQVNFINHGEQIKMSKRKGKIISLDELMNDIPNDVSKFFFLMRNSDSHLDYDIELAKTQSNENPVYYIQYAYARICSILKKCEINKNNIVLKSLGNDVNEELQLMKTLSYYPDEIKGAGINLQPHRITNYLRKLAGDFHSYYNKVSILKTENEELKNERIALLNATKKIIKDGLEILNISAPEKM